MFVVTIPKLLGFLQGLLLILFCACTTVPKDQDLTTHEYIIFRDIMVMLLLGFGYLMTFLKQYGLSAVGFTMVLTVFALQLNILVEPMVKYFYSSPVDFPLNVTITSMIEGEFAAATLLISFGAVIGRATPLQLFYLAILQSFFYALNKVMIVFGACGAEDVGGSISIHLFGAYFGIAASAAFRRPKPSSIDNCNSSSISDILSLVGTTLLWVYWPSFVGATESSNPPTENLCVLHTILALLGSTGVTFALSPKLSGGKFNPVHIANSTLAGGVAVGASARLAMTPGGAVCLGAMAGLVSVLGYDYVSPMLERRFGVHDTCGVHNLHGLPSLLGGLASAVFVALDAEAEFLSYGAPQQAWRQVLATIGTVAFAVATGFITGCVMVTCVQITPDEYDDAPWWVGVYFDANDSESETGGSDFTIEYGKGSMVDAVEVEKKEESVASRLQV